MAYLPRNCPNCREKRVREATERYEVQVEHDGRTYVVVVPDLALLICDACGNRVLPPEADDRVSDAIRAAAGLLAPADIVNKRLSLNLTPGEMAELLKIPEPVYSRWETGGQIQQRHSDLLLRSLFEVPELRRFLSTPESTAQSDHPQVA